MLKARWLAALLLVATCAQAQTASRDFVPDDYAEVDTAAVTGMPLTIFIWGNPDADSHDNYIGLYDKDSANDGWYSARRDPVGAGGHACQIRDAGDFDSNVIEVGANGEWQALGCTFTNATTRSMWIGTTEQAGSVDSISPVATDRTSVGRHGDFSPSASLDGQVAHGAIWSLVPPDAQMKALALGYSPQFFPKGLAGWWPMMTSHATTLLDRSGNGVDLTLTGSPPTSTSGPPVFVPTGGQ